MIRILVFGVLSLWFLGITGCRSDSPLAGTESGSQTTNGIVLGLVYPNGKAGANIFGSLRTQNYLTTTPQEVQATHGSSRNILTDSKGNLELDSLEPGEYLVEVNDKKGFAVAVRCSVSAGGRQTNLGVQMLTPTGIVQGSVFLDPNIKLKKYVQVYGLERIAPVDLQTGMFALSDMPAGNHRLRVVSMNEDPAPIVIDSVAVPSGATVVVPVAGERFSKTLHFNTTPAGADVAGNVYNFPVCVRLTNSNFKFSEARPDGSDLRFAKSDNTSLPFEIERWDAANGRAEIWVTVDTIFGNDSTHYIRMFWGNKVAAGLSNGTKVFDTTSGFRGVWHLADNSSNSTVANAVGTGNAILRSGTTEMNTAAVSMSGQIGPACNLTSTLNQWVDLGAEKDYASAKSEITVSVWMFANTDPAPLQPQLINFSIGGSLDPFPSSRVSLGFNGGRIQINTRAQDASSSHAFIDSAIIVPQTWYHIVGVLKIPKDSIYLYINGRESIAAATIFNASATDPTPSTHSSIGANDAGTDRYFSGVLDEARMESIGRTPDWIKLNYQNQKANDALIFFK